MQQRLDNLLIEKVDVRYSLEDTNWAIVRESHQRSDATPKAAAGPVADCLLMCVAQ